jgi:hypothetical protein
VARGTIWIIGAGIGPLAAYAGLRIGGPDLSQAMGLSWLFAFTVAAIRAFVAAK